MEEGLRSEANIIRTLWIGELGVMEWMSLNSYLSHGHRVELYVYGPTVAPAGVEIKDANEIIPMEGPYDWRQFNFLANYSDYFRMKLLLDKGGWWCDLDSICMKPLDFSDTYVFASEIMWGAKPYKETWYRAASSFMKAPANSELFTKMWKNCQGMNIKKLEWLEAGMDNLKNTVDQMHLVRYLQPPWIFCPFPPGPPEALNDPRTTYKELGIKDSTRVVHLWNDMWGRRDVDKNIFYRGSFYDRCREAYAPHFPGITVLDGRPTHAPTKDKDHLPAKRNRISSEDRHGYQHRTS